jgi:hypothetical protein
MAGNITMELKNKNIVKYDILSNSSGFGIKTGYL